MSKEAMKLALEALETCTYTSSYYKDFSIEKIEDAIKALEEALAKQEKPFAHKAALYSNDRMKIDPVTGDVSIGTAKKEHGEPVCRMRVGQDSVTWYDEKGNVTMHVDSSNKVTTHPQPKQEQGEPVGVAHLMQEGFTHCIWSEACVPVGTKFYTTPQQRTWVGLTDGELVTLFEKYGHKTGKLVGAIEDKLKEKNT
jgi:hypothetical protein